MGTKTKILAGIGIIILLLIGVRGLYPNDPITVAYATPNGEVSYIESPGPPYFYLDDNNGGVLVIDISPDNPFYPGEGRGLSVNSVYVLENVFTIENNQSETGYEQICVRISSDTSAFGFFEGTFNGSWSEVIEVTLSANETVEIGMRVNTTGLQLGDYWDSVNIEAWGGSC